MKLKKNNRRRRKKIVKLTVKTTTLMTKAMKIMKIKIGEKLLIS